MRNRKSAQDEGSLSPRADNLTQVPTEIMLDIIDLLVPRDILHLSFAAPVVSWQLEASNFWRRRIIADMPWMWDLRFADATSKSNWPRLYFDLQAMCNHESKKRVLGLVNRSRIWRMCLPLAEHLLQKVPESQEEAGTEQQSSVM